MKLLIENIKIDGRSFDEARPFAVYVPTTTDYNYNVMIDWLQEYDSEKEYTRADALIAYIRAYIFNNCKITFDCRLLFANEDTEAAQPNQTYVVDVYDQHYDEYRLMNDIKLKLPKQIVLDEHSFAFAESNDELQQQVFEALLHCLKIEISELYF